MPNVNNKKKYGPCTVEGCHDNSCAKGLCNRHYLRNRKYGSPIAGSDRPPRGLTKEQRLERTGWDVRDSGCWEWRGSLDGSGYGQFHETVNGARRRVGVHRLALEIRIGRSLTGTGANKEYAMHICDNRKCVNPDHLEVGTHLENMRDMKGKGRANRKLSDQQISEVRMLRGGGLLQREIADKLGVTQGYISEILRGTKRRRNHD